MIFFNKFYHTHKLQVKVIAEIYNDGTSSVGTGNPTCDRWHLEQRECDVSRIWSFIYTPKIL